MAKKRLLHMAEPIAAGTPALMTIEAPQVIQPWERQDRETEEAWTAFQRYRGMRSRCMQRASTRELATVHAWAKEWRWHDRCMAFDRYLDGILVAEQEAIMRTKAATVASEHIKLATGMQALAKKELVKLMMASEVSDAPGLIRPSELTKMVEAGVKLERLARGQATEIEGQALDLDLGKLSNEELAQLIALEEKARPRE